LILAQRLSSRREKGDPLRDEKFVSYYCRTNNEYNITNIYLLIDPSNVLFCFSSILIIIMQFGLKLILLFHYVDYSFYFLKIFQERKQQSLPAAIETIMYAGSYRSSYTTNQPAALRTHTVEILRIAGLLKMGMAPLWDPTNSRYQLFQSCSCACTVKEKFVCPSILSLGFRVFRDVAIIAGRVVETVLGPTGLHLDMFLLPKDPMDLVQRQSIDIPVVDLQQLIARFQGNTPSLEEPILLDANDPHFAVPFADLDPRLFAVFGFGDLPPKGVTRVDHLSLLLRHGQC
jgi:hypothetical protein